MKRKFRRKDYIVEAEPWTENGDVRGWLVHENGGITKYPEADFEMLFEEVSQLHRVQPLRIEVDAEGAD